MRMMTELVACLSTGKGSWNHINKLIKSYEWDNIFLITNEFGYENFNPEKKVEMIVVDTNKNLEELREEIISKLKGRIKGTEIALNLISGSGKEHMALLSSLLKIGVGVRFVDLDEESRVKEV